MGFWKNVDEYLKFKGINRKTLAAGTSINSQTIDRAIQRDSDPKLVEGLKICKFLKVPVEDFLDNPIILPNESKIESDSNHQLEIQLYRKYHDLIADCEHMPEYQQNSVRQLAQSLAQDAPSYTSSK